MEVGNMGSGVRSPGLESQLPLGTSCLFVFFNKFMYLLLFFGCVGSSLLHVGFL